MVWFTTLWILILPSISSKTITATFFPLYTPTRTQQGIISTGSGKERILRAIEVPFQAFFFSSLPVLSAARTPSGASDFQFSRPEYHIEHFHSYTYTHISGPGHCRSRGSKNDDSLVQIIVGTCHRDIGSLDNGKNIDGFCSQ